MKEPEQHFLLDSIDQLTERSSGGLPAQDSRLIADLYQTYAPLKEENDRSLQHIWSRFAQAQEQHMQIQEGQRQPGGMHQASDSNTHINHPNAPVPGTFQQPFQPPLRGPRRLFWRRLSSLIAVAIVLLSALSLIPLTHPFLVESPQITLGMSLPLDGGPQLNRNIVLLVKSNEGNQYLATMSYDTYDGHTWNNTAVSSIGLPANKQTAREGSPIHLVTQQVTLVNPPAEQQPYIYAAGQVASVDRPATELINNKTGSLLAVLLSNGQSLTTGEQYTVQSYVSSANITQLRSVPLPADTPKVYTHPQPPAYYNPAILSTYLQLPEIDPHVKVLALQLTARAHTMYDKAVALETYFRTAFTYSNTIHPSPATEATAWLLFHSNHRAFCNYFASAMAVMARELGMPARMVVGYTAGTYDAQTHNQVVRSSDAHTWTQIYFASYGWISFEPSPSFAPLPSAI